MSATSDRRNDAGDRVPLRFAVEVGHGDFADRFEASSVNLSKGGLSLRAACLPDVGSRLACRFRCQPRGALVTAECEVIWAQLDGERHGEFGLAFLGLDPETEWLLDEMIAEQSAHRPAEQAAEEPSAVVTTLELEGSPEPIEARLTSSADGQAIFEQPLDLLSLGRLVRARAPGTSALAGSIAAVELRLVGNIPMLAVTVDFGRAPDYGEVELDGAGDAVPSDTAPDLAAAPPRELSRSTVAEFEAPAPELPRESRPQPAAASHRGAIRAAPAGRVSRSESRGAPPHAMGSVCSTGESSRSDDSPLSSLSSEIPIGARWGELQREDRAAEPAVEQDLHALARADEEKIAREDARISTREDARTSTREGARKADFSAPFLLERDADPSLQADLEALATPPWKPVVAALLRALRSCAELAGRAFAGWAGSFVRAALPRLREWSARSGRIGLAWYQAQAAPRFGALRRLLSARLLGRRRRTTTAPAARKPAALGTLRLVFVSLLAASALALGVYALAPSSEDGVLTHRSIERGPASAHSARVPAAAVAPGAASAARSQAQAIDPTTLPSAAAVPASSPFAVDVRERAGARPAGTKLRFGAASVPGGRRFALRMSAPVKALQGSADAGGFTVIISGALSLDRAGPISTAHPVVQRAMVINKGDRAELSIRFAQGKQPAYQVTAEATMLYLLIGQ